MSAVDTSYQALGGMLTASRFQGQQATPFAVLNPQLLQSLLQSGQLTALMKSMGNSMPLGGAPTDPMSMLMGTDSGSDASPLSMLMGGSSFATSPQMRNLQAMQTMAQGMGGSNSDDSDDDEDDSDE